MPRKPKPDLLPRVIRSLIYRRERAGITKHELSRRLGYSYDTVKGWERGEIHPSFQSMLDWCEYFSVSLDVTEERK